MSERWQKGEWRKSTVKSNIGEKNAQASCEKSVGNHETSEKKQQPHVSKIATGKMSKKNKK